MKPITDFGFDNLLVSGCSFTSTTDPENPSWPHHLREMAGFRDLIDLSCSGAGNTHIHHSVIWELERNKELNPSNTFIVIMWSGYDRDDIIVDPIAIDQAHGSQYQYAPHAWLAITGGVGGVSNTIISIDAVKKIKNLTSRSIENYVLITGLYHYLTSRGFRFVFTEFATPTSEYDLNFEPTVYLGDLSDAFRQLVRQVQPNLGDYSAVGSRPNRHPAPDDYESWCRSVLIPFIKTNI